MTHPSGKRDLGGEYQSAITGMLADTWDWYVQSGISPLSPQHAIHKLSRYEKEKYPEGVQNKEQMLSLFDDPEYARLSEEASMVGLDPASGLLGTVRKVAPKVARAVPKDPMIVQHNINPETLPRVERMGGIPAPSIGIVKAEEGGLKGFGRVSLLGGPEMAKPSAKNPIWGADAYTTRTPQIEVVPNKKAEELVKKYYHDTLERTSAHLPYDPTFETAEQIFKMVSPEDAARPLRAAYLKSKGIKVDYLKPKGESNLDGAKFWERENSQELEVAFNKYMHPNFNEAQKFSKAVTGSKIADLQEVRRLDFNKWIKRQKDKIIKEGGTFEERVFKGYTQMGNRRYAPATMENVVKEMKGGAGGENWSGAGLLRASVTPPFKSFPEVKKARGKIQKSRLVDEAEGAKNQMYADLEGEALDYLREWGLGSQAGIHSTVEEFAGDLVRGKKPFNYVDQVKEHYPHPNAPPVGSRYERFLAEIPASLKNKAKELREEYQKMPTEYFEIKPQRGVALSEFKGAIVPENLPKHQLKILKDAGIKKIHKYSDQTERKELLKKYPELMFLAPPVVGAGLLADQEGVQ